MFILDNAFICRLIHEWNNASDYFSYKKMNKNFPKFVRTL